MHGDMRVKYPRGLNASVCGSCRGSREEARPVIIIGVLSFFTRQKLQNHASRSTGTWSTHAKHTGRDRQIAGVATNVSPDVTRLDPHGDDDDSGSELDGRFYASSASHRAHNRFQLRDDNDRRPINPLAIYFQ